MPENLLYQERNGRTDFTGATTKQLQLAAWKYHPGTSNLMAPRGLGYYDAFATPASSAVTTMTIGPTTPLTGITVIPRVLTSYNVAAAEFASATTGSDSGHNGIRPQDELDAQLLIIGPARGSVQARLWRARNLKPDSPAEFHDFHCPQLELDQPVDGIPARFSVQIKNY